MPLLFFVIPALRPEPAASALNHCLATQQSAARVRLQVQRPEPPPRLFFCSSTPKP